METKKKSSEALGVTFNGSVTFNGPMFDIHDNAHVHIGVTDKKDSTPAAAAATEVPEVLTTPEGLALKARLVEAALLTDDWQPVGLTGAEKGELAMQIAIKLDIKDVWKLFGTLWGIKQGTLRAYFNRAREQEKNLEFQDRLKKIIG